MPENKCPVCSAVFHDKGDKIFHRCISCKALIRKQIDPHTLDEQYKSAWDDPANNIKHTGATDSELAVNYVIELRKSLKINDFNDLKILDYGAGRGVLSLVLQNRGADIVAVDPYGYDLLVQNGIKAFHTLDEIYEPNKFDGVVCIDVIEHLTNPISNLKQLLGIIKEHGWLFVSTPNNDSLNARITLDNWRETQNPGHLVLFNSESLQRALMVSGFSHYERLKWNVIYNRKLSTRIKDWILLTLRLDGELRYLAIKEQ